MTVASTSSVIAQTSTATFDAWVNEIYTNLVTNCGLSQLPALMDTGQMAVPSTTAVPGAGATSAGYYMFAFNDTLSAGTLGATVLGSGGTGYDAGGTHTYTAVPLTGGSGSGAQATIVVTSGVCANATITTAGTGYKIGDNLSASNANLGGSGSGLSLYVSALTSNAPVIIKMEFGSGTAAADPQVWVTIGSGWASNGTLIGSTPGTNVSTRVAQFGGGAPASTVTAYPSRYVYNSTYGFLGLVFKLGGQAAGSNTIGMGALIVFRSNDTNGNATNAAVMTMSNQTTATGSANTAVVGAMQCLQYASGVITAVTPAISTLTSPLWGSINSTGFPFGLTSTLQNGVVSACPAYYLAPSLSFSAYLGTALITEAPMGNSVSMAFVGATDLTFLSVGQPFGAGGLTSLGTTTIGLMMLWQ